MKIYKYPIPIDERTIISCAGVLSAIEQNGEVVVYALDDEGHNEDYFFHIVGTGWDLDTLQHFKFLVSVKYGAFVWHVFYRKRRIAV